MKGRLGFSILLICCSINLFAFGDSLSISRLLADANLTRFKIETQFAAERIELQLEYDELLSTCKLLHDANFQCWIELQDLQKEWIQISQNESLQLLEIRYRKGIDLIKLLYEKILALDHHFSSMKTFQDIGNMANPNSYPGFQQVRGLLENRLKRRNLIQLPGILQSNPYLTATFSLVASLLGDGEQDQKQKDFDQIACILDFTVRMRADLSVILHETEYLKLANHQLKEACEKLFEDYVNVIDYLVTLDKCRANDDWETLFLQLDRYVDQLEKEITTSSSALLPTSNTSRDFVNLEFSTQRVAEFIGKYNDFINLGTQYYQKFDNIVSTYENEEVCADELPYQFEELQDDIQQTIEKFHNTYRLPEIQGSRMKDLLYGFQG